MVQIRIITCDKNIHSIEIKGHSNSAEKGKDLVCAGISSIGIGLANAIDQLSNKNALIKVEDNRIIIEVIHEDEILQVILKTGIIQLKTIEEVYSKFVNIETVEEKV